MAEIKLFIATSVDGYIARPDGSLDWLDELPVSEDQDYGYGRFIASIDTIIMGRSTYDVVAGFDLPWPYPDQKTLVVTSDDFFEPSTPDTYLLPNLSKVSVQNLRKETERDIWLVGGGKLISAFLEMGEVDEMTITVIPRLLGEGIRLFPLGYPDSRLQLIQSEYFETGVVNLIYRVL